MADGFFAEDEQFKVASGSKISEPFSAATSNRNRLRYLMQVNRPAFDALECWVRKGKKPANPEDMNFLKEYGFVNQEDNTPALHSYQYATKVKEAESTGQTPFVA